ncbi:YceD family protein [Megalodesulfovibrio paquesii]
MPCRMGQPLRATLHLTVHEGAGGAGVHIRGRLQGSVIFPCDRCAEDCETVLDVALDDYESEESEDDWDEAEAPAPAGRKGRTAAQSVEASEDPEPDLLRQGAAGLEFDVQGYLWQQFVLALPTKPLCTAQCKGLCPQCGANWNVEQCNCTQDEGDPRLAVLRQLKRS